MCKTTLTFEELELLATDLGQESCVPDILGETVLQNGMVYDLGEDDEIFEDYGRRENAYPYRKFNAYSDKLETRKVKTAVLENDYIKATFLPEYGGRLWALVDKTTGKDLLYTNDVLRFRNLAVRNAWFSGGVEWNIGIIGHTPFTTAPLYVAELENEKGSPVLRMYEFERIRRVFYQMDFWLDEEDRALNCRMRIVNQNKEVVPMYWWSNIAVPEFEGGRIIVPAHRAYTAVGGRVYKVDIPYVNNDGVDITRYKGIPYSVDHFFEIDKGRPKYIANVDKDGYGLLQVSTGRLQSRKLFSWGHTEGSAHWQRFLTKDAGDYVEIQAGLGKTQYGCIPMPPHSAWEWMEQYGSVQLDREELYKSNEETSLVLDESLCNSGRIDALEEKLNSTKQLAKTKARLIMKGSGYGAMVEQNEGTEHLEFVLEDEALKRWKSFADTGVLHQPKASERPDGFFTEEMFELLKANQQKNSGNWYFHYQLGIGYYINKDYEKAESSFKESYELAENAWAAHALGCLYLKTGRGDRAVLWMVKGLRLESHDASYLKEAFKILSLAGGCNETVEIFEALGEKEQRISRLRFYYILAKFRLGECKKALELLEENGGLEMEDLREGEDSVEQLWKQLNYAVNGEERAVPQRFVFSAHNPNLKKQ